MKQCRYSNKTESLRARQCAEFWAGPVGRLRGRELCLVLRAPSLMGSLGAHTQDQLGLLSAYSLLGMSGSPMKRWKLWQHPLKQ